MKYFKVIFMFMCLISTCFVLWKCTKDQQKEKANPRIFNQREDLPTSDPCEGGDGGNCTGDYNFVSSIVSLSDYPDCTFEVAYLVRICPVRKMDIIILYIDDFGDPSGPDPDICQDFQDDIDALDSGNYPVAFELWFDNFENKIAKALALQLTVNQAPECGGSDPPTTVSFISAHCNYTCYWREDSGTKYYTTTCGDVCCEQKYTICKVNGIPVITKIGSTTPSGNCQSSNYPRSCPENTFYRSTCKEKCRFNY